MALGKAVERHAGQVGRERADGFVAQAVHHQTVVDFIRQDHQMMLTRDFRNRQQHLLAVNRAGRVVRVDDQNRLGAVGDFAFDVLDIRIPFVRRVAAIENRLAAAQIGVVAPQGIARRRQQDLVARADQRVEQHARRLAHAVADEHVVGHDALQSAPDVIGADDVSRRRHAAHIAIRNGLVDMQRQRLTHAVGQLEAEPAGVARIELEDVDALGFHAQRLLIQRAADIGMDMIQSV